MGIAVCDRCNNWYERLPDLEKVRLTLKCKVCQRLRTAAKEDTPIHVELEAAGVELLPGFERD